MDNPSQNLALVSAAPSDPWNDALEAAAKLAEAHNENHCENRDTTYRNCGLAIAAGIRDMKGKSNGA